MFVYRGDNGCRRLASSQGALGGSGWLMCSLLELSGLFRSRASQTLALVYSSILQFSLHSHSDEVSVLLANIRGTPPGRHRNIESEDCQVGYT